MKAKIIIWLCCLAAIASLLWIKSQREHQALSQLLFEHQKNAEALDRWVQDNPKDKISDGAIRELVNQLLVPKPK